MAKNFNELEGRSTNYQKQKQDITWTNVGHGHLATCGTGKKQAHKGWIEFNWGGKKHRLFASTYTTQTGLNITIGKMNK